MTFCIFCGQNIRNSVRTKEHILPVWLLKATGDPHRQFQFGFDPNSGEAIVRPASTFHFPACQVCNQKYGKRLETRAAKLFTKIGKTQTLSVGEAYQLLDWLDKVRIGIWLAFYVLRKEKSFLPKFHIDTRLSHKDRVAIISVDPNDTQKRLSFGGFDNVLFEKSQCALYLAINNIKIITASFDYLVAKEAGLPYAKEQFAIAERPGFFASSLKLGTSKVSQKWGALGKLSTAIIAQPIIDTRFIDPRIAANVYFNSRILQNARKTVHVNKRADFQRLLQLQIITKEHGRFQYQQNLKSKIKLQKSRFHSDAAFLHQLYIIMLDRVLRMYPYKFCRPDGTETISLDAFSAYCNASFQIMSRLERMGMPSPQIDLAAEEVWRLSRLIEERDAP
jgi:hypothetical protein